MREEEVTHLIHQVYQSEPSAKAINQAQMKLTQTINAAKMNAILFGSFEHLLTGLAFLAIRNGKLIAVDFGITESEFIAHIEESFGIPPYLAIDEIKEFKHQVYSYLDGDCVELDIPIDISQLTDFQRQVLFAALQIPRGQIRTYMDIARQIGKPKAARAVGQALGHNPVPIVIPCHRVVASDGSLGGYSGGGGLETKAKLLQLEGASLI